VAHRWTLGARAQHRLRVAAAVVFVILSFIRCVAAVRGRHHHRLAPVVITATAPTPARPDRPATIVRDRRRAHSGLEAQTPSRTLLSPRRRHPAVAQRGPGKCGVGPAARCQREARSSLVDGVPDRLGHARQVDFAGIALSQIERIEILRGPGVEPVRRRCASCGVSRSSPVAAPVRHA
jgi:hypothetical protein